MPSQSEKHLASRQLQLGNVVDELLIIMRMTGRSDGKRLAMCL
jgi:hypothetical protein